MTLVLQWRAGPALLRLRWIAPGSPTIIRAQAANAPALAVVIGPPGPAGPAGELAPAASLVTEVDVPAGMPLAINRSTGRFVAADALIYARSIVVGLAIEAAAAGFVVDAFGSGNLQLPDWSAVTGAPLLSPGHLYFLREGGGLTTSRPTAPGSSVTIVAEATSPTTLNLRRAASILL